MSFLIIPYDLFLLFYSQDMIPIKGLSVCNGQHPSTCEMQTVDDPIVQRFREAGAIILGTPDMCSQFNFHLLLMRFLSIFLFVANTPKVPLS
jgi:hypothetical protein